MDLERLLPEIYGELRELAARHLSRERPGHTLQTTALVHEAYLRLVEQRNPGRGRARFLALASRLIRRILADHGRRRRAQKRGGDAVRLAWLGDVPAEEGVLDAVELSDLLDRLATIDEVQAAIVEMRVYGGLPFSEISEALELSVGKVHKEWRMARAWLLSQLEWRA